MAKHGVAKVIQALLIGIRQNTILEAERATIEFEKYITNLRSSGMSDAEIKRLILADFLDKNPRLFGAYKNAIREEIAGAVHQADALGAADEFAADGDQLMRWTTVGDQRTCEDCEGRAGRVQLLSMWRLMGLPKSGFSRCGRRCRCELTPARADAPKRIAEA